MSLKAADGAVAERRRLTTNQVTRPMMAAIPTTPPTTPPAIAPAFELVDLVDDDDVVEDPVAAPEEPVKETDALLGLGTVAVDCTFVAVDSGESPSACAALRLNPAAVTSRYAQFGTAVPDGMLSGNCWVYTEEQL